MVIVAVLSVSGSANSNAQSPGSISAAFASYILHPKPSEAARLLVHPAGNVESAVRPLDLRRLSLADFGDR
jgi:hypothetical protein